MGYNCSKARFWIVMTPEEMILNLFCLERDIVQLSDLSSVQKQFDALNQTEKRRVARKIRKLAKKFVNKKSSNPFDQSFKQKNAAAGFGLDSPRSKKLQERFNRVKIIYARRFIVDLINRQNRP